MKQSIATSTPQSFSQGFLEKLRFLLVGCLNTGIDFFLYNILIKTAHFPLVLANIISTSVAMVVSLQLNKYIVFRDTDPLTRRQLSLFLGVTLASLWLVQSVIIWLLTKEFPVPLTTFAHELAHHGLSQVVSESFLRDNIAKIIATVASLIWNYYFYKRLVFKKHD